MYFNREHEEFDMAMELLCTLPLEGCKAASVTNLASDLTGGDEYQVHELIIILRSKKYVIDSTEIDGIRRIFVNEFDWNRVKLDAARYWNRVYGR